jgi:molydopterin dinucleotide binding protein
MGSKARWEVPSRHALLSATSLRRRARDPEIEMHPTAAAARGIRAGDWVHVETPEGSVRARAQLNESLAPSVACGQHGWWQACPEIGAPGYDPFGPNGANFKPDHRQRGDRSGERLRAPPRLSLPDPARGLELLTADETRPWVRLSQLLEPRHPP